MLQQLLSENQRQGFSEVTRPAWRRALLRHMMCEWVNPADIHRITCDYNPEVDSLRITYHTDGNGSVSCHYPFERVEGFLREPEPTSSMEEVSVIYNLCETGADDSKVLDFSVKHLLSSRSFGDMRETRRMVRRYCEDLLASFLEVSSDGITVWVNAGDGTSVGRFGPRGIDVHYNSREQALTGKQCKDCTHTKPTFEDWDRFVVQMHAIGADVASYLPGWLR